jgi:DNA-binding XRE family transcriptional regulator
MSSEQDSELGGYVYLFEADNHLFKLGRSFDPSARVARFNTLPVGVHLVHKIESSDAKWLERVLHRRFSPKRIRGEWFALTDEDVAEIVAIRRRDPPEQRDLFGVVFGARLRQLREGRGLSRAELARKADLPAAKVALLEDGKEQDPRLSIVLALARALAVGLDELAG